MQDSLKRNPSRKETELNKKVLATSITTTLAIIHAELLSANAMLNAIITVDSPMRRACSTFSIQFLRCWKMKNRAASELFYSSFWRFSLCLARKRQRKLLVEIAYVTGDSCFALGVFVIFLEKMSSNACSMRPR